MTGNGIESDFVLPDSLFISDYSTLPSFYPHFGANCRFFCTISMSPDSSALFCSPNAASGLRQRVFDPLDSRSRDSVERIFMLCPRVNWGNPRGAAHQQEKNSSSPATFCILPHLTGGKEGKHSDADGIHPARADDAGQALPRLLHTAALRG